MMASMLSKRFWDWVDARYIVRRLLLVFTATMCGHAYFWAVQFAETTGKAGAEVGLIVAAVTAPVSLLMAQIAKLYNDGRGT